MRRMAEHNNGIALIFARTDTACWHKYVFGKAAAILFVRGRPNFHLPDGRMSDANCGAPVALVAYGEENAAVLSMVSMNEWIPGKFIRLDPNA